MGYKMHMSDSLLLDAGRDRQALPLFDSTHLTIIAHSPTRRVILARVFRHFFPISTTDYSAIGDQWQISEDTDFILADRHNLGPEERECFQQLLDQTAIPLLIIDSSQVPVDKEQRRQWGSGTAEQIINIFLDFHHGLVTMAESTTEPTVEQPSIDQKPGQALLSLMEDIETEAEQQRLSAILDKLPMEQYHEIDNDRPLVTAEEMKFDYSAADEFRAIREEQQALENNSERLPDFSDFDEIFGGSATDDYHSKTGRTGSGTLTTWFSSIFARLRGRDRKRRTG